MNEFQMKYDFVAIGDITSDAFIRLKDASVSCDINREHCKICLSFGDKVPYESVTVVPAVGNSPNAAVSAARLGLKTALVTNIGADEQGKECLAALAKEGIATEYVKAHQDRKTNYHYVLWYEDDRTILIKHENYVYALPEMEPPGWIYLSSLSENAASFHDEIEKYLNANKQVNLAFQPGTFQMKLGVKRLAGIYARTKVFICNKEEAERILSLPPSDIKVLLRGIRALGPEIAVITDGPLGAYVYEDEKMWKMPIYPDPKPPFERTGAGDAFSSTLIVALALSLPITDALRWAPVNSMSVVQEIGAQAGLLTREKLEGFLRNAPANYKPELI